MDKAETSSGIFEEVKFNYAMANIKDTSGEKKIRRWYHDVINRRCNMKSIKTVLLGIMFIMFMVLISESNVVKVKAGNKVGLNYNTTYNTYDVTGDGVADKLILTTSMPAGDLYKKLTVYVNDQEALTEEGWYFYADTYIPYIYLLYMDNGKILMYIHLGGDNDDGPMRIYEYQSGTMQLVADLEKDFGSVGYHVYSSIKDVGKDTLNVEISGMSYAIAGLRFNVTYKYVGGKLKLTGKTHKIKSYDANYKSGKSYLTAKKKITLYKDKTTKKKLKKFAKGTKIKFSKIYVSGSKVSYYGKTKSGKKGWFKSKKGTYGTFKESLYAG